MQTVPGINELPIARHQDLGGEITAGESRWQAGDSLPGGQSAFRGIVVEQNDVRAFLLDGVAPASIGMEEKMPRSIAGRQRHRRWIVWRQDARARIKFPDEDL